MRVACTAIVKDSDPEHTKTKAMLQSTLDIGTTDWVIAVDKKSVPGTVKFIEDFINFNFAPEVRAIVFEREWTKDFSAARNATLAKLASLACDWWYWVDSDDVIVGTEDVSTFLDTVPRHNDCVYFNYDYERDNFGNSTTTHTRGRFYRGNTNWIWRGRVHEDCHRADGLDPKMLIRTDDPYLWVHDTTGRTDDANERNVELIRLELEEDPTAPRPWYYLGNHFFAKKDWAKAVAAYERYVGISNWDVEKWTALIYQAISYRCLGDMQKSIETDTKAMHLIPEYADSYFGIGEAYTRLGDWHKALHFGQMGMERVASGTGVPPPVMFVNINAYQFNPYMWMAVAFFNIGENEKALAAYEQAAKARPEPDLLRTIDHLKWSMARDRITRNGLDLAAGLMRRNEPLKAKAILLNLPAGSLDDNPNVRMALRKIDERISHLYDPVEYKNLYFREEETAKPEDAIADLENGDMPRMAWALRRLKGANRVLDIGIGNGTQALYLAKNGIQVVGIDVDRRRVKDANWAAVRMGLLKTKKWLPPGSEDGDEPVEVPDISSDSPVQFHMCSLGEIPQAVRDLGPFDAVLAAELIEHVEDPKELLDLCESVSPRILLTTPDGAYDGPQAENPGHVIAFSQRELTRLVMSRGRIVEMHKVSARAGAQANILCEYIAGEQVSGDPVVIWCPDTQQGWTPESIYQGGIGGSETAVIRVAEELAKTHRVTVYAECEGVYRGVRYAKTEDFMPQPCALFVAWRSLGPIAQMAGLAERRMIWAHDIHFGAATPEQLEGVEVLALSRWHKQFLEKQYPGADVVTSSNGIDPDRFDKEVERQRYRLIYAQSPDRGLDVLLDLFPKIRARYPDAELHVFYGFELARQRNPQFIADIEQKARQPGVFLHGRIDQARLAEEYLKSDVLLYPATMPNGKPFDETYCISVVEAQAAGCVPITPAHGALAQTNKCGIVVHDAEPQDLLDALFDFWQMPRKAQDEYRQMGHMWATENTWTRVALGWLAESREPVLA